MKTTLLILLLSLTLYSAPSYSHLKEFKNSDGTTFYAIAKGNHKLNWIQTQDGDILKYNTRSKNFEFAKIEGKRLIASGKKYTKKVNTETPKVTLSDLKLISQEY
jgi:hypothetical protein